ncbi:MAG: sterol desaturase family protein [Flavobacteriales bacterium]|nr:sterol desaturase family protein [Flavobacteriales bacterium]
MDIPKSMIVELSIPIFFLLIGIELIFNRAQNKDYYRLNDALSSISNGIGSEVIGIFSKLLLFSAYIYIFENWKFVDIGESWWAWTILFLGVDFTYYWFHRKSHEVNFIWAAHIVHHSSEEYNLTTALRQAWFQNSFSWVFYLPLAFMGFSPAMFVTVKAINLVYQFWIHTKLIGKLGFLELFMNTPSHHRVHHGKNPKYLDKNYAATFIIWDRMFGTFQKEEEEPVYGITNTLNSWNPIWSNFHYWNELFKLAGRCSKFTDKIKVFFMSPGWAPEELGGFHHASEIDKDTYVKYDVETGGSVARYSFVQFVPTLVIASLFLFMAPLMNNVEKYSLAVVVVFSVMNCGLLFEQRKIAFHFEFLRYAMIGGLLWLFQDLPGYIYIAGGTGAFILFSAIWLWSQRQYFGVQSNDTTALSS